jgi:hypothetical protein
MNPMKSTPRFLRILLFRNRPLGVRIWIWTALVATAYPLLNALFRGEQNAGTMDAVFMAYGIGSLAIYLFIYGFDWK